MKKFSAVLCASALSFAAASATASTVTIMADDGEYTIDSGGPYAANVVAGGGAGDFTVKFTSSTDPFTGISAASITNVPLGTFSDLTLSWLGESDGAADTTNVFATIAVTEGTTSLETEFSNPDKMMQYLQVSWTGSQDGIGFDLQVTAVPLPASVLFLGAGIGGLGLVARRRKKAA